MPKEWKNELPMPEIKNPMKTVVIPPTSLTACLLEHYIKLKLRSRSAPPMSRHSSDITVSVTFWPQNLGPEFPTFQPPAYWEESFVKNGMVQMRSPQAVIIIDTEVHRGLFLMRPRKGRANMNKIWL